MVDDMLKRYTVSNFKSFKETTVFDLEKTNYQMLSDSNTNGKILKGVLFVGANASGKSNSIMAIKFLLDSLLGKKEVDLNAQCCVFAKRPVMKLKYEFEIDGAEIIYEIEYLLIDKLLKETLLVDNKKVFWREGSYAEVAITEHSIHKDVPGSTLFLRDIYFNTKFRGNTALQNWFAFLKNSVYVDLYSKNVLPYKDAHLSLKAYLDKNGTNEINDFFRRFNFEQSIEYDSQAKGQWLQIESSDKMIFLKRKGIEEPMPYLYESLGNRTLLTLLPAFFYCIKNKGMLLLDEFSSGFHNDLEELLIRFFMKSANGSQIIFVSHSTNLLSTSLLRPDQIYSVEFDAEGSKIKRFSSEKPREAQNLEKMYLSGVFNGVPGYESTDQ